MLTHLNQIVPYYQPETAYQIFNRIIFNTDVATGKAPALGYISSGSNSAFTSSPMPPHEPPAQCYLWDILETCTTPQKQILRNGSAVVENFILIGSKQADNSILYFNGTTSRGDGTGPGGARPNSARALTSSGSIGTFLLSLIAVFGLQAALSY